MRTKDRITNELDQTAEWLNDRIDPRTGGPNLRGNKKSEKKRISQYDMLRYSLLGVLMLIAMLYIGRNSQNVDNIGQSVITTFNPVDEDLVRRTGTWMAELGYTGLSREDIISLRNAGVTATFTSRMHELGYKDLSIDDLKRLREVGVTETFTGMMHELGYKDLSKDDLILLKQRGLTADFTAKVQNMGYPDVTVSDLIRLKNYNVTTAFITKAKQELGENITIDEVIRHKISNQ